MGKEVEITTPIEVGNSLTIALMFSTAKIVERELRILSSKTSLAKLRQIGEILLL